MCCGKTATMRYLYPQLTPVLDFVAPHSLDSCVRLLQQQNQPSGRLLVSLFPVDDNSCRFEVTKRGHRGFSDIYGSVMQRRVEGYLERVDQNSTRVTAEAPEFFPRKKTLLLSTTLWGLAAIYTGVTQSWWIAAGILMIGMMGITVSLFVNYLWQRDQNQLICSVQELLGTAQ